MSCLLRAPHHGALKLSSLHYNTLKKVTQFYPSTGPRLSVADNPPKANFIPTRKGSMLLVHDGYAFRLKNKLAYGKKQWYCTSRMKTGCHVDVTTVIHHLRNVVNRVRNTHNHPPPGFYRRNDGSFKIV